MILTLVACTTGAWATTLYNANGIRIVRTYPADECITVTQVQTGVFDIEISNIAASQSAVIYTLSATSAGVKIRNIWVEPCVVPNEAYTIATLIVNEAGGTFDYIQSIRKRPCDSILGCDDLTGDDGVFNLSVNFISGHIGHPTNGGSIDAIESTGYFLLEETSTPTCSRSRASKGCLCPTEPPACWAIW